MIEFINIISGAIVSVAVVALWALLCAFVGGWIRANYFELRAVRERREREERRRVFKVVR